MKEKKFSDVRYSKHSKRSRPFLWVFGILSTTKWFQNIPVWSLVKIKYIIHELELKYNQILYNLDSICVIRYMFSLIKLNIFLISISNPFIWAPNGVCAISQVWDILTRSKFCKNFNLTHLRWTIKWKTMLNFLEAYLYLFVFFYEHKAPKKKIRL